MTDVRTCLDIQNNNPFQVSFNLSQNKIEVYSKEKLPTPLFFTYDKIFPMGFFSDSLRILTAYFPVELKNNFTVEFSGFYKHFHFLISVFQSCLPPNL